MNSLVATQQSAVAYQGITEGLFNRFVEFIDARPKTVETYSRALRQFFRFLSLRGVMQPTREDVIAFREEMRQTHKPGTIQLYVIAVRQFFKWTAQEGFFPNIAENVKGAKLDREHKKDYLTSAQSKEVLSSIDQSSQQGNEDRRQRMHRPGTNQFEKTTNRIRQTCCYTRKDYDGNAITEPTFGDLLTQPHQEHRSGQ